MIKLKAKAQCKQKQLTIIIIIINKGIQQYILKIIVIFKLNNLFLFSNNKINLTLPMLIY